MADIGRHWKLTTDGDDIAWLYFDMADSSTNLLSGEVLSELNTVIGQLEQRVPTALVILSGKRNGFAAGADIREFVGIGSRGDAYDLIRRGQAVFDRVARLPVPTIGLIHGFCLGGGLELALACDYRIARDAPDTRIGLPEVGLGIHPGFGGSVRLTTLIGGLPAMDLMLSGRSLGAGQALRTGILDYALPERHLMNAARDTAMLRPHRKRPGLAARLTNQRVARPLLAWYLHRRIEDKAPVAFYPAPHALIDIWARERDDPGAMLEAEALSVAELVTGDTAQNLVRVFFLRDKLKALGRGGARDPRRVHVIGAGLMGGDIAAWCAMKDMQVTLQDRTPQLIAPAIGRAVSLFRKRLHDRVLVQQATDRLMPDPEGLGVARADIVIEAITEDRDAKRALFREIEPLIRPDALLATNTSSIALAELAGDMDSPGRLVGLHFFNPVAKMQLVEIIGQTRTDGDMLRKAREFACRIDRLPLPAADAPGFLVNRVLMPYLLEAVLMESEGVPASVIDDAARGFGMPIGPLELADNVGLDLCLHVARTLAAYRGYEVPRRLQQMVETGRLGRKSGNGYYGYRGDKAIRRKPAGFQAPGDLVDRLMLALLNEAVACWSDRVVTEKDHVDAGLVFGAGFAPHTGGPLRYIEEEGARALLARLQALRARYGDRFKPHPGWGDV